MRLSLYIGKHSICIYIQVLDNLEISIYKQRDVTLHTLYNNTHTYLYT